MELLELISNVEKLIEISLIHMDAETILSLMRTEKDPIFSMAIIPYYALFIQSCREYLGDNCSEEDMAKQIKDIRDYIKAFADKIGKSKRRINRVDTDQNALFQSEFRFDFLKSLNIHYNLGTYWTKDYHIIGNTQMYADFLNISKVGSDDVKEKLLTIGCHMSQFISSVEKGLSTAIESEEIKRNILGTTINYYYDLNTNKNDDLFKSENKFLNLY